jgi:hypothetical protein
MFCSPLQLSEGYTPSQIIGLGELLHELTGKRKIMA